MEAKKDSAASRKRLVLLDLFGVVITEGHLVTNITSKLFPEVDVHRQREAYHAYERDEITAEEFWRRVGSSQPVAESERLLFDHFRIDPEYFALGECASSKGMRLAVLSNIPKEWKPRALEFGIGKCLSEFLASGEERVWKPEREFYELACRRLGVELDDCVFVDDQEKNLVAAAALGIGTVWVDREAKYEFPSGFEPDYRVESLSGLVELICGRN